MEIEIHPIGNGCVIVTDSNFYTEQAVFDILKIVLPGNKVTSAQITIIREDGNHHAQLIDGEVLSNVH